MSAATVESTAKHERREAAPRPLGLLIAGLIVLGVSIVFAVLVLAGDGRPSGLQTVDDGWRRLVGAAPGAEQSPIAMFFQYAGSLMVIISAGPILFLVLLALGRWRSTIFAFLLLAFSGTVLNLFAKQLITRERPTDDVSLGLYGPLVGSHGGLDSFPSGHTGFAAAIALIAVVITSGRVRVWMIIIGSLFTAGMIWQRTFFNAHWLSDTIGAGLAAVGFGLVVWWAMYPVLKRDEGLPLLRWKDSRAHRLDAMGH